LSIVKVSTFNPSQNHSPTEGQSFRFRVKFLARPPLLERWEGRFFPPTGARARSRRPCHWFLFWNRWIQLSPSS